MNSCPMYLNPLTWWCASLSNPMHLYLPFPSPLIDPYADVPVLPRRGRLRHHRYVHLRHIHDIVRGGEELSLCCFRALSLLVIS